MKFLKRDLLSVKHVVHFLPTGKTFRPKGPSSVAQEYKTEHDELVLFCTLVQLKKAFWGRNVGTVGNRAWTHKSATFD